MTEYDKRVNLVEAELKGSMNRTYIELEKINSTNASFANITLITPFTDIIYGDDFVQLTVNTHTEFVSPVLTFKEAVEHLIYLDWELANKHENHMLEFIVNKVPAPLEGVSNGSR